YERKIRVEMNRWVRRMSRDPSLISRMQKRLQRRLNAYIPEKVHTFITHTLREMVKGVLWGSAFTTGSPQRITSFFATEEAIREKVKWYRRTGSAEGGIAGAGGFALALAEFPVLMATKMKMLFEIARLYGINVNDYRERLYILYIFQLAYSGQENRNRVFARMKSWDTFVQTLPAHINDYNWQEVQQEYRDYLDRAKLAQLIPGIGIPVGIIVNYRLMNHLADMAM